MMALPTVFRSPWLGRVAALCSIGATAIAIGSSGASSPWRIGWGVLAVGGVVVTALSAEAARQGARPFLVDINPLAWKRGEPYACGDHFHDQYTFTVSAASHGKQHPQVDIRKYTERGMEEGEFETATEIGGTGDITVSWTDHEDGPPSDHWRLEIR